MLVRRAEVLVPDFEQARVADREADGVVEVCELGEDQLQELGREAELS